MNQKELIHINDILAIPIADGLRIAVSKDNKEDGDERLFISLETENGDLYQDICCVRPHWEVFEDVIDKNRIDCMVYADCNDENYTYKAVIDIYRDKDKTI